MRFPTQNAEKKENLLPTKGLGKNGISDLGEKDTFLLAASGGLEDGWGGRQKMLLCDKVREKRVVGFLFLLLLLPGEFETLERGEGRKRKVCKVCYKTG